MNQLHSNLLRRIRVNLEKREKTRVLALSRASLPVGTPDLLVVRDGLAGLWEVKTGSGRATQAQLAQLRLWSEAGCQTAVVRALEEAERLWESLTGGGLTAPGVASCCLDGESDGCDEISRLKRS